MSWKPHKGPQLEFCSRGEFEVLFGGAAGPGKTDCLIMLATKFTWHPKYRAIIIRRTFPQLQEIIDRCWQYFPQFGAQYRAGEHRWYFPEGSSVQLGHMQHEDDKYNFQGKEFQFIGFDEVTQFTETHIRQLSLKGHITLSWSEIIFCRKNGWWIKLKSPQSTISFSALFYRHPEDVIAFIQEQLPVFVQESG